MVNPISNTPTRNRKVGLPDNLNDDGQAGLVNPNAPAQKVVEAAQQSYALKNGGQMPMSGSPDGNVPAVGTVNPNAGMNVFGGGNQILGKYSVPNTNNVQHGAGNQPQTSFEGMPQQATGWNADGTPSYDTGSLSAALNGGGGAQPQQEQAPAFEKDETKRDGGFFGWLKNLMPKARPGRREGESDDDYDRRMTANRERLATLADAFRHLGNIINTSKGAPLQQFNDPTAMLEQGYQNRKAQRQRQAALDADAAYKNANLTLKERAAEADRAYKQMNLGFKQQAAERAAKNDEFNFNFKQAGLQRQLDNDKFNHDLAGKKFDEQKRHNAVSEGQSAARIALAQERNGIARARLAHTIATSGGGGNGGRGGSLTNLSTPTGHVNRKKDLNSIEKKQITQLLIKNGYIDKKNLQAYQGYVSMGNTQLANDLQNYWIAYAANMPGKKGDAFRTILKNHYMYTETNTTATPKVQPKATPKTAPKKPTAKGSGVSGKSNNGYKNTKALGL